MALEQRICHAYQNHRQRGVTLIELLVAVAISLFMIAALVTLYVNNSVARQELDRSSRQIENGRFAIDMMRDDLALAGYYGEIAPRDVTTYTVPNPCEVSVASMGWSTAAAPSPLQLPVAVQGPQGTTTIPSAWSCGTLNQRADTGYLVVRRAQPDAIAATAAGSGVHYIQTSGCLDNTTPFRLDTGPGASKFTLTGTDCATVRQVRPYLSRLYYVSTCGICSPSDDVPTLKVRELRDGAMVDRTIADGIEDLQFEFGRDTNGDGIVDSYVTSGAATDWQNVVAVRIWVISRSTDPSPGYTDNKTYDRGTAFGPYPVPAGPPNFKRRVYSTLVQLPNVAGPREAP